MPRNPPFASPEGTSSLHPLVAATEKELARLMPDKNGFCHCWGKCIRMRVSPAAQVRALLIADLVIRAIEHQGFKVGLSKNDAGGVWVSSEAREIELIIREEMKRFIHKVTPEEEALARDSWTLQPPKYDWRPTGNISVVFEAEFETPVIVKESGRRKQEERIPRVLEFLIRLTNRAKQHDAELTRLLAEGEAKRIADEVCETDEERESNLIAAMSAWQRAEGIRAFVCAARKGRPERSSKDACKNGDFRRWATWALSYADRIDPLRQESSSLGF